MPTTNSTASSFSRTLKKKNAPQTPTKPAVNADVLKDTRLWLRSTSKFKSEPTTKSVASTTTAVSAADSNNTSNAGGGKTSLAKHRQQQVPFRNLTSLSDQAAPKSPPPPPVTESSNAPDASASITDTAAVVVADTRQWLKETSSKSQIAAMEATAKSAKSVKSPTKHTQPLSATSPPTRSDVEDMRVWIAATAQSPQWPGNHHNTATTTATAAAAATADATATADARGALSPKSPMGGISARQPSPYSPVVVPLPMPSWLNRINDTDADADAAELHGAGNASRHPSAAATSSQVDASATGVGAAVGVAVTREQHYAAVGQHPPAFDQVDEEDESSSDDESAGGADDVADAPDKMAEVRAQAIRAEFLRDLVSNGRFAPQGADVSHFNPLPPTHTMIHTHTFTSLLYSSPSCCSSDL
jgi:hypothetical protein